MIDVIGWSPPLDDAGRIAATAVGMLLWAILVIRVVGLRSLSKMSSFDFVVTVALGSITATAIATTTPFWRGAVAFAVLLAAQWTVARLRLANRMLRVVENRPLLLVDDGVVLDEHLRRARIAPRDLRAKLRESNVHHLDEVRAVVLETTGDVAVITGDSPVDPWIMQDVETGDRTNA